MTAYWHSTAWLNGKIDLVQGAGHGITTSSLHLHKNTLSSSELNMDHCNGTGASSPGAETFLSW